MPRLDDKICPFINKECVQDQCALFDERLDNCAIQVLTYNLYKLDKRMAQGGSGLPPGRSPIYPVPPQT